MHCFQKRNRARALIFETLLILAGIGLVWQQGFLHQLKDIVPTIAPRQRLFLTPNITYGIELAFLFPHKIYHNVSQKSDLKRQKRQLLHEMALKLQEVGVPARFHDKNVHQAPKDKWQYWKLKLERGGFEAASPLSPDFDDISTFLQVVHDFDCLAHPQMNLMHVNVDARNKTLQQARNVYKNAMTVEPVLERLSPIDKYALGGKSLPLGMNFTSIQEAYQSLDASEEFSSLIWLGLPNWNKEHRRIPYRVALELSRTVDRSPQMFEFRVAGSSHDPMVPIAWIKLATRLVEESYAGHVLEPQKRSVEETTMVLFGELLNDPLLQEFFQQEHQRARKGKSELQSLNEEICSRPFISEKVQTHLCHDQENIG